MSTYRGLITAIKPTGAMTGTATVTSQVFNIQSLEGAAFQPVWTGTPTGTFKVEVSLDYQASNDPANPLNPGTWSDLGASVIGNPAGGAGNTYIPVYASCAGYIRLSYTNASGSGVLKGTFAGKTRG